MVRPRLVEEGAPIYGPGSEATTDHEMNDTSSFNKKKQSSSGGKGAPVSSLQRLASKSKLRNSLTKSSYVVGGGDEEEIVGEVQRRPSNSRRPSDSRRSSGNSNSFTIQPANDSSYTIPPGDHCMEMEEDDGKNHVVSPYQASPRGNTYQQQHHHHHHQMGNFQAPPPIHNSQLLSNPSPVQTSYEIGGDNTIDNRPVEKMEGVEDLSTKTPMVVLDGANVAHAYWHGMAGSSLQAAKNEKPQPDVRGIQVATDYFEAVGIRVLVVLPQYWFRSKPRPGVANQFNSSMVGESQLEILNSLQAKGWIVASPPADDDDAYALTIARREEAKAVTKRNGEGPGFVLSNDMFRDAQQRDGSGSLENWLNNGRNQDIGPGRISYTFCDMGTMDDHGDRILDFVPNPRHPLTVWMESAQQQQHNHDA